jgi:hypothetical protein
MELTNTNDFSLPPPTGMTIITGKKLESLKAMYHDLIAGIVGSAKGQTLLFSHFGDFDPSKNDSILKLVESGILELGDKRVVMKRVCSMLIELLQNISIHGARDRSGHMHSYLIVVKTAKSYKLYSANLVLAEDLESLKKRMEEITMMDETTLRKLYIEILCNEEFSHKGGAGLGLITIAKRASKDIRYNLQSIDEHFGYFTLEVEVPGQ